MDGAIGCRSAQTNLFLQHTRKTMVRKPSRSLLLGRKSMDILQWIYSNARITHAS